MMFFGREAPENHKKIAREARENKEKESFLGYVLGVKLWFRTNNVSYAAAAGPGLAYDEFWHDILILILTKGSNTAGVLKPFVL